MNRSPSDSPAEDGRTAQLARLREWVQSTAKHSTYRATDKHRYAALAYDGQEVVMTLLEAEQWIKDSDETYTLSERWLTPKQYENLPEFEGF